MDSHGLNFNRMHPSVAPSVQSFEGSFNEGNMDSGHYCEEPEQMDQQPYAVPYNSFTIANVNPLEYQAGLNQKYIQPSNGYAVGTQLKQLYTEGSVDRIDNHEPLQPGYCFCDPLQRVHTAVPFIQPSFANIQGIPDLTMGNMYSVVPQNDYTLNREHMFFPLITFRRLGRYGIPVTSALKEEQYGLDGADDGICFGDRLKISHRLRVRGLNGKDYNLDRQVPSRRSTGGCDHLKRSKVANHIARSVEQCMKNSDNKWTTVDGIPLRLGDLFLLALINVSQGSWQPVLAYLTP
ncbi:hypothetical protein NM688_g6890 [Phlebia brevispora]|uniref:Uncharacterized protein n=1 Tax=Phlebia brevispora TaxID=194682 RepID=A0ACC1SBI8_9APHY|nr:hypothetical protein NM688_g6890 [Phlebia brevispora]